MPATHHRDFLHQLRVLLFFIEFNILIFIMMERQRTTYLNPAPSLTIQLPAQPPGEEKNHQTPGSCPGSFKDNKRYATATFCPTSYTLTYQDTRILSGCHMPFWTSTRNAYTTTSRSQSPFSGGHKKMD